MKFVFDDGSFIQFDLIDDCLSVLIQAKHLGKEVKTTSASVSLTKEETIKFKEWIK